jgi:hypothetical protein
VPARIVAKLTLPEARMKQTIAITNLILILILIVGVLLGGENRGSVMV